VDTENRSNLRTLLLIGSLLIVGLIFVSIFLILTQRLKNKNPVDTQKAAQLTPTGKSSTATPPGSIGYLPLLNKQPTPSPTPTITQTPTPTITLTPTITPTPTPLTLSFCNQAGAPITIHNYETITDTLQVDFPGDLLDLNLGVEIDHTFVGDLSITLKMADGPQALLLSRPGPAPSYCAGDNIDATFDDEADTSGQQTCNPEPPAITGDIRPLQALSIFDGWPLTATWQLVIKDSSIPDEGQLKRWCLIGTTQQ
jgi:subtilisin-like proprotein convertase family protein